MVYYVYNKFVGDFELETFNLFRPIFYLILMMLIFNLLYVSGILKKVTAKVCILVNSLMLLVVSIILVYTGGILADQLVVIGDSMIFAFMLLIGIINLLMFTLVFYQKGK